MAQIKFDITGDNSGLVANLRQVHKLAKDVQSQLSNITAKGSLSKDIQATTSSAVSGFRNAKSAVSSYNSELKKSGGVLDSVTSSIGNFAKGFTAAALAMKGVNIAIDAIRNSWNTLQGFQSQNATLSAILGQSPEEMGVLIESAKELGRRTIFTSSQVTQLQIELSKLGFKEQDILNMSNSTLQFAMATGADLGQAAATTGAAIRMFGASTAEADRYTAAMAAATTNSALNFQAIADNLATFGPMAHSLGMSIEDVLALFGKLKDAGVDASTAMTSLRNIFTRASQGKIEGFQGINGLEDFVSRLQKMSSQFQGEGGVAKALKQAGNRGGTQFITLMQAANDAENGILALKDKILRSEEGALSDMSSKMTNTVEGSLKMLSSAWEGFILEVGNSSLGPVKGAIDTISNLINGVTDLASGKSWSELDAGVQSLIGSIGVVIPAFLAYQGYLKGNDLLVKQQVASYQALEAEIAKTNFVTKEGIATNLQDQVSKGKLTLAQAQIIQKNIEKAESELVGMQATRDAIEADLERANRINKLGAEMVELCNQEVELAEKELAEAKSTNELTEAQERLNHARKQQTYWQQQYDTKKIDTSKDEEKLKKLNDTIDKTEDAIENMGNTAGGSKGKMKGLFGSIMDFGKSMLSSPFLWISAAIWAVSEVIEIFSNRSNSAKLAQEGLNDAMEEHERIAKQNQSTANQLTSTINDETKAVRDQIKAWKDLKEIYDNLGVSMQEFKAMSVEEQQQLIANAQRQKDEENFENYDRLIAKIQNYQKQVEDAFKYSGVSYSSFLSISEETLKEWGEQFGIAEEELKKISDKIGKSGVDLDVALKELKEGNQKNKQDYFLEASVGGLGDSIKKLQDMSKTSKEAQKNLTNLKSIYVTLNKNSRQVLGGTKYDISDIKKAKEQVAALSAEYEKSIKAKEKSIKDTKDTGGNTEALEKELKRLKEAKLSAQEYQKILDTLAENNLISGDLKIQLETEIGFSGLSDEGRKKIKSALGSVEEDFQTFFDSVSKYQVAMEDGNEDVLKNVTKAMSTASDKLSNSMDTAKTNMYQTLADLEKELTTTTNKERKIRIQGDIDHITKSLTVVEEYWEYVKVLLQRPAVMTVVMSVLGADVVQGYINQFFKALNQEAPQLPDTPKVDTPKATPSETKKTKKPKPKKEPKADNSEENKKKEREKAAKELEEKLKDARKALEDLNNELEDTEISRNLATLLTEYKRDLEEINDSLKEAEKLSQKAGKGNLSKEDKKVFQDQATQTRKIYEKARENLIFDYNLSGLEKYIDLLSSINDEHAKRQAEDLKNLIERNKLENRLAEINELFESDKVTDERKEKLKEEKDKLQHEIDVKKNEERRREAERFMEEKRSDIDRYNSMADNGISSRRMANHMNQTLKLTDGTQIGDLKELDQTGFGNDKVYVNDYKPKYEDTMVGKMTTDEYREFVQMRQQLSLQLNKALKDVDFTLLQTGVDDILDKRNEIYDRRNVESDLESSINDDNITIARLKTELEGLATNLELANDEDRKSIQEKIQITQQDLVVAQERLESEQGQLNASRLVTDQKEKEVIQQEELLKTNAQRLTESWDGFIGGIEQMGNAGSLSDIWSGLESTSEALNIQVSRKKRDENGDVMKDENGKDVMEKVGLKEAMDGVASTIGNAIGGPVGSAIASMGADAIFQILDILSSGLENLIAKLLTTLINAMTGLIKTFTDPEVWIEAMKGVVDAFKELLFTLIKSFTFGVDVFGLGDNKKEMQEKIDKLNAHSEALAKAMQSLEKAFSKSYGASAVSIADDMAATMEAREKDTSNAMIAEAEKHDRWRVSLNKSVQDNKEWKKAMAVVSSILGKRVRTSKDFLRLTGEEMQQIIDYDRGETWNKILEQYRTEGGKNGKSDQIGDMLYAYVDEFGNKTEDITDMLREKLTQITFDSMRSDFVSTLMDMESDAEAFSDKFSEYMMKAMLENQIGELMQDDLDAFHELWTSYMADDGSLTRGELDSLRAEYERLGERGLAIRDQIAEVTGYDQSTSASGSSKGVQGMTQDTAEEMNGRLTSIQISNDGINTQMALAVSTLMMMNQFATANNAVFVELRAIAVSSNSYLADIAKYNKSIYLDFSEKLDKVIRNTDRI